MASSPRTSSTRALGLVQAAARATVESILKAALVTAAKILAPALVGGKRHGEGGGLLRSTASRVASLLQLSAKLPAIRSVEDLATIASAVANERHELMFTTVSIDKPLHQLIFLRQWYGNLRSAAPHAMLLGADARTCRAARNATIPCFVDGVAPMLRGKQNMFGHQVLLKWWYAKQLLGLSYHIVFSDPDIAWLADPFDKWDTSFDLQGLSDIRHVNVTTQKFHEITCLRPWMEQMYEHSRRSIYPCQSTGLWFMRDRPQTRALLVGLYNYLEARPNEWEQKAFQLIVMRYLVGLGDDLPPMRYRLLPTSKFINIEFYEERVRLGMDAEHTAIGVHCGYLKNTRAHLNAQEWTQPARPLALLPMVPVPSCPLAHGPRAHSCPLADVSHAHSL